MLHSKASTPKADEIELRGVRVHNLKNISIKLPHGKLIVLTGPSGSGKSSLAFDTLFAEGQRRYVESLSAYARQFVDQLQRPDVEWISGLTPTLSIEQRTTTFQARSTVGTVTEILDYFRVLFARIGEPFCWKCGAAIQAQTPEQIVDHLSSSAINTRLVLLAPIVRDKKGEFRKEFLSIISKGFNRARVDGEFVLLNESLALDKKLRHTIEVVVDRILVKADRTELLQRLREGIDLALETSGSASGIVLLEPPNGPQQEIIFSTKLACTNCKISYLPPEPRSFSFNSPMGACPTCEGLGVERHEDNEQSDDDEASLLDEPCPACLGSRLKPEACAYRLFGMSLPEMSQLSLLELSRFLENQTLSLRTAAIAERPIKDAQERLRFLLELGLEYLQLSRPARSLSGGELQRIRLASQLGNSLVGVTYILDEPSIGLHPRDTDRLLHTLERLRDRGNTVIVVEHDEDTICRADWVVDIGPGAGIHGGEIVAEGTPEQLMENAASPTGSFLSRINSHSEPKPKYARRSSTGRRMTIKKATVNNLKALSVEVPLGCLVGITGVSGSGKSSLVFDALVPNLAGVLSNRERHQWKWVSEVMGFDSLERVASVDQSPIGRTPRSNPATYLGLFTLIRDLFASLPGSQIQGLKASHFSFNTGAGRCIVCEGDGLRKVEMHFLPPVYIQCETCRGLRYNESVLSVQFRGKSIADVLKLSVEAGIEFFQNHRLLRHKLETLSSVGLGYLELGQSSTTLSGGEAQRVKLCRELSKKVQGNSLYVLDEPTTGLHFKDVQQLTEVLNRLVDQGNTVIVVEHHLDLIAACDYVLDLGPESGSKGGTLVASGTPEDIANCPQSITGRFLKQKLFSA